MRTTQAYAALLRELRYQAKTQFRHVPALMGPVGSAKTTLVKNAAEENNLLYLGVNCGENSDSSDFGVPMPQHKTADVITAKWALSDYLHTACTEPCLLHFDDVDKAPPPAQNALLGVVGERRFRDAVLHAATLVVLSGNRLKDDMFAHQLSESMRTRITTIVVEPDLKSFAEWGSTGRKVHPAVIGYLGYKPDHLHKVDSDADRFPTPRCWEEASVQLFEEPEKVWKEIVSLKVGDSIGPDFWAWYEVILKINIQDLLKTGSLAGVVDDDRPRLNYAAIFALTQHFKTSRIDSKMIGLPIFINSLEPEMRLAFAIQLDNDNRAEIAKHWPQAATDIMQTLLE